MLSSKSDWLIYYPSNNSDCDDEKKRNECGVRRVSLNQWDQLETTIEHIEHIHNIHELQDECERKESHSDKNKDEDLWLRCILGGLYIVCRVLSPVFSSQLFI